MKFPHSPVIHTNGMMRCVKSIKIIDGLIHGTFKLLQKQNYVKLPIASAYMESNGEANNKRNSAKFPMKVKKKKIQDILKIMHYLPEGERPFYDLIHDQN